MSIEITGTLMFSDDGTVTGYVKCGNQHFQISGLRATPIRTEIKGRALPTHQEDMFERESDE